MCVFCICIIARVCSQLSENREKVRRSQPLPQMDTTDIDSRTIYIENLPTHLAEHEAIKKLFKMFGKIIYVRLVLR